jgi:hypothetical protein
MDFVINAPVLSHNSTKLGRVAYCPQDIERLVLEPKELGEGMPVVEKNVQAILSPTHVLTFDISGLAEITDEERR